MCLRGNAASDKTTLSVFEQQYKQTKVTIIMHREPSLSYLVMIKTINVLFSQSLSYFPLRGNATSDKTTLCVFE